MGTRGRMARVAAVSNGMVWFGLALFVGCIAVELAPAAFAGGTASILGWAMLLCAAIGLTVLGAIDQLNMRAARMKSRPAPQP